MCLGKKFVVLKPGMLKQQDLAKGKIMPSHAKLGCWKLASQIFHKTSQKFIKRNSNCCQYELEKGSGLGDNRKMHKENGEKYVYEKVQMLC